MAEELWCQVCDIPLSLKLIIEEKKLGVASVLLVKCTRCDKLWEVNTNVKPEGVKE